MTLHQTIRSQITEALRAKDTIRLDTLRGLNALIQNEMLAAKPAPSASGNTGNASSSAQFLSDDRVLALVKRSAKQRKDSIEQFRKGGREDLASKEEAELRILESFLPAMMSREEIKLIVRTRIEKLKSEGAYDPKAAGRLTGLIMKELVGKADGADVKAAIDELTK